MAVAPVCPQAADIGQPFRPAIDKGIQNGSLTKTCCFSRYLIPGDDDEMVIGKAKGRGMGVRGALQTHLEAATQRVVPKQAQDIGTVGRSGSATRTHSSRSSGRGSRSGSTPS